MAKPKHGRHAAPDKDTVTSKVEDQAATGGDALAVGADAPVPTSPSAAHASTPAGAVSAPAGMPAPAGVPASSFVGTDATVVMKPIDMEKGARNHTPLKVVGIVFAILVGVVALIYVAGAFVFMGRFYPSTVMGGVDVSLKSPSEVQQVLSEAMSDYTLEVSGQGFSLKLTASDAGMSLDGEAIANSILKKANPWIWPYEVFQEHDETASLAATYNESGLSDTLRAAVDEFNATATAPTDAYVAFDDKRKQFAIVPEEAGTMLSADAIVALVDEALVAVDSKVEVSANELAKPNKLSTDPLLTQAAASANGMILVNVTFNMAGTPAATLDASVVSGWITFGEDMSAVLDAAAMGAWADQVAAACTTTGTERTYTRADGKQITVSGGAYGWVVDRDALLAAVQTAIDSDQTGAVDMPCSYTAGAYTAAGARDWGNRYVDVDLSEQYARMYDDSGALIWESAIVSGKPGSSGTGSITPSGVYYITQKQSPSVLLGTNDDGSKYESHVTYWMPFVGNAVGLHDASWQSSFGGTRYRDGAGSHGCVNLPTSKAADLYSIIKPADVVVVHW